MDSNDKTPPIEQSKTVILLKKYNDSIVVRSLVQAIPYIGSVLDIALTNTATKIKEDRAFQYLSYLAEKIKTNEEQFKKLSQNFPEEMLDAILYSTEASAKTRSDRKKQHFADILSKQVQNQKSWEDVDAALQLVNALSDLHFKVLLIITEAPQIQTITELLRVASLSSTPPEGFIKVECPSLAASFPDQPIPVLKKVVADLQAQGLIQDAGAPVGNARPHFYFSPTETADWFLGWVQS